MIRFRLVWLLAFCELACAKADVMSADQGSGPPSKGGNAGSVGGPLGGQTGEMPPEPVPTLPDGGEVVAATFPDVEKPAFAGAPDPNMAPTVVYPLAHALFPSNLAPVEFHLRRTRAEQTLARVHFHVAGGFDFYVYTACAPAELDPLGCIVTLPDEGRRLAQAAEVGPLEVRVRLSAPGGAHLGEATLQDVSWARAALTGGLYYWSAVPDPRDPKNKTRDRTMVRRFSFVDGVATPENFWESAVHSPAVTKYQNYENPSNAATYVQARACVGCHAISRYGDKIALTYEGSLASSFTLVDVATKTVVAARTTDPAGFATETAFAPETNMMINGFRGKLTLRTADATLLDQGQLFESDTQEAKAAAFWSPTGSRVAFVSFVPAPGSKIITGDLVREAQIWMAPSDGRVITGPAKVIVPRTSGQTNHYPSISVDGNWVVFSRSSCGGPFTRNGWGDDPCDGYNDPSARVMLVASEGGAVTDLKQANGTETWTNSWPRFSPDRGRYRKDSVMWVAFSSRRPYGLRLEGSTDDAVKPQLWFAAIRLPLPESTDDPSFAPVWLPNQNDDMKNPSGNHAPQWVVRAIPVQ